MSNLKSTGIVRKIDDLGRMVIPIELRKTMNISPKDPMEIFTDGSKIILKKYEPGCEFCGSMEDLINYSGHDICTECVHKMEKKAEEDE